MLDKIGKMWYNRDIRLREEISTMTRGYGIEASPVSQMPLRWTGVWLGAIARRTLNASLLRP